MDFPTIAVGCQAFSGIVLLFLTIFSYAQRPEARDIRAFMVMTIPAALWVLLDAVKLAAAHAGGPVGIISSVAGMFVVMTGWGVLYFSIRFPYRIGGLHKNERAALLLTLLGALCVMPLVWLDAWVTNRRFEDGVPVGDIGWAFLVTSAYTFTLVIAGLIVLGVKRARTSWPARRVHIAVSMAGIAAYTFFAYLFSFLLPRFGIHHLFFLGPTSSVFFVAFHLWALVTRDFFHFRAAATRVLLLAAGFAVLGGIFYGGLVLFHGVRAPHPSEAVLFFFVLLLPGYMMFTRLIPHLERRWGLNRATDLLIHRAVHSVALHTIGTFPELCRRIAGVFRNLLGLDFAMVLLRDPSGNYQAVEDGSAPAALHATLSKFGRIHRKVVPAVVDPDEASIFWVEDISDTEELVLGREKPRVMGLIYEFRNALYHNGVGVYAPVRYGDQILAYFFLGRKTNGESFQYSEIQAIRAVSGVIGLGLKNNQVFGDLRALQAKLRVENEALADSTTRLTQSIISLEEGREIVYASEEMGFVIESIERAAANEETVLVNGESGTGKELAASLIHRQSGRKDGPFLAINCGAVPESLLENELFGHEKGAFTGAHEAQPGLFERCQGGTIFLDEVGEMPMALQVKLLRVLQEKTFARLGGKERKADVRIVAATNRDLEAMVKDGEFRMDLFYRLNVIRITMPPLRLRRADIPVLTAHYLAKFSQRLGKAAVGCSEELIEMLGAYDWPGNVRELENLLLRALVGARSSLLTTADFPEVSRKLAGGAPESEPPIDDGEELPSDLLARSEFAAILRSLEMANGKKSQAAEILGVSRSTFYEKLKKYGIKT